MVAAIYQKTGQLPRGLGDRSHFFWPGIRQLLQYFGVVLGSRDVCTRLMRDGQSLLVFPGGGREVMKRKGDALYEMFWGEKTGFAELVVEHDYTIIPVASVGTEDCLQIAFDLSVSPILRLIGDKRGTESFSVPLVVPRTAPQRIYLSFGAPIHVANTATPGSSALSPVLCVRDAAYQAVLKQIDTLRTQQESDTSRYIYNGALFRSLVVAVLMGSSAAWKSTTENLLLQVKILAR
jgi:1-acyl-sn-glycerol-3-phosphate acyltransferase